MFPLSRGVSAASDWDLVSRSSQDVREKSREEETLKGGRKGRFWKGRRKEEMGAGMSNCRENREDVMAFIE